MSDSETKTKKMSAAAFFNDNRAIAGFGNSMRAVFTSIRELVENGLDAAENRGINPKITLELRRLSSDEIKELLDIREHQKLEKHIDFLQLTCRDNGVGVSGNQIADLFGRVLTGTKYGVIQTRGRFGLGAKMCLLYSMSSVDLPAKITSRYFMNDITHEVHLMINLEKNEPIIMEQKEYLEGHPKFLNEPGTEIQISFTGAWNLAKNSIKEYFRQLAIITPYASFEIKLPSDDDDQEFDVLEYDYVVEDMPPPPKVVKIHPYGCDITQFKAELSSTNAKTLTEFLSTHFMGVNERVAEGFFHLLEIDPNKNPNDLSTNEIRRIVHEGFVKAYQEAKDVKRKRDRIFQFDAPKGDALSPLGANRLKKGLEKELEPVFVEAISRPPKAYSGHPFIIEAAVGYGGGVNKAAQSRSSYSSDNKIIYRYANRIPLIFGAGNDVITKVVNSIKWNEYGLTRQSDPLAIAVSVVSTKIPFPETSKEYIASTPELEEEIRLALQQLGRRLKTYLGRAKRKRREHVRLSRFVKSAPVVIENLVRILDDEKITFTDLKQEIMITSAALAHGTQKKVKLFKPLGTDIYQANIWCPEEIQEKLHNNDISSIGRFLYTSGSVLSKLIDDSQLDISDIKRRTIYEFDKAEMSPPLFNRYLIPRQIEKRFKKKKSDKSKSLKESLYKRWIQNSYHYLATSEVKLAKVNGLLERLLETKKNELLERYMQNKTQDIEQKKDKPIQKGTLDNYLKREEKDEIKEKTKIPVEIESLDKLSLKHIFPSFEWLKENTESIQPNQTLEEFIFDIKRPNSTRYYKDLTKSIIEHIIKVFTQLSEKFPEFGKIVVTKMSPDWMDGYTKNAFHRRDIETVSDFINFPLKELVEIREMERSLYADFISYLGNQESISLTELDFSDEEEELSKEIKTIYSFLKKNNINTLAKFLSLPIISIYEKRFDKLALFLLDESKVRILDYIKEKEEKYNLSHIKIIPRDLEIALRKNQIFTTTEFLSTPITTLRDDLNFTKKEVIRIKNLIGTELPNWIQNKTLLSKIGINSLEEIFFSSPEKYDLEPEERKDYLNNLKILRTPIIFALPELRSEAYFLKKVGINCVGRFLIWPNIELAEILETSVENIQKLKEKIDPTTFQQNIDDFGKDLSIIKHLYPRLYKYFKGYNLSLQELFYLYPTEKLPLDEGIWERISHLNHLAQKDILEIVNHINISSRKKLQLRQALLHLKGRNYLTIRALLDTHPDVLRKELPRKSIRKPVLEIYSKLKSPKASKEEFTNDILLVGEYDDFLQSFALPTLRINGLDIHDSDNLMLNGIVSIQQIFDYNIAKLSDITGRTQKEIQEIVSDIKIIKKWAPFFTRKGRTGYESLIFFDFEESERFSSDEIESLINCGYSSVDELFYLTNKLTFSSPVVKWEVIHKFKQLLRSPLTLVSWEEKTVKKITNEETGEDEEVEDTKHITLSTPQLNKLREENITRIIDLLFTNSDTIAKILNIGVEKASKLQRNVRISDTGINLADFSIFKPEIIKQLESINIVTIEDLYFSTAQDKWKLDNIPWSIIATFKKILNLPLINLRDMLDAEIIDSLTKANISTLLGFLLSSPKHLMQITGIPDERFENIRSGLDLSELYKYFTLPIYYLPEVSFDLTEELRENDIAHIIDFIDKNSSVLGRIINSGEKRVEIGDLKDSLTVNKIFGRYEELGIFAFETKLFDKNEQRKLSRDSIFMFEGLQTIQEIYYLVEKSYYQLNLDLWNKISAIKNIMGLPLRMFSEISDYSMEILKKNNITLVYQLLFIPDGDITEDELLYDNVSTYSSTLIDFRSFHYFGHIPAKVYNAEFLKDYVVNFEEVALLDAITSKKLINHFANKERQFIIEKVNINLIRSLLELPLQVSPFIEQISTEMKPELSTTKIGELFTDEYDEFTAIAKIREQLKEYNAFNVLIRDISFPIVNLGLEREAALKLSKASINTLIEFYSTPIKTLADIAGASQKYIRETKEQMIYSELVSIHEESSHPINESSIISQEQINKLNAIGINSIERFYFSSQLIGIADILSLEDYRLVQEILSGSLRFISFLSFEEYQRLEEHNMNSIIDLSLLTKQELFAITNNMIYQEFHILDLISFDEIAIKREKTAIPLTTCPSIKQDYLEKITNIGIHSIQDFISRMDEIRESHPNLVNLNIFKEVELFNSSIAFLTLSIKDKNKLLYSGLGDILTFVTEDPSTISLILDSSEKQIKQIKDKISVDVLKKQIENNGIILDNFNLLTPNKTRSLLRSGKNTVQDLYAAYYQAGVVTDVSETYLESFIKDCENSIYCIDELEFTVKTLLAKNDILRVIDLVNSDISNILKECTPESRKALMEAKQGIISLNKGNNITIDEEYINQLKIFKLEPDNLTVESIYAFIPQYLKEYSETIQIEKIKEITLLSKLISTLSKSILAIEAFSLKTKTELWSLGIRNIIEIFALPHEKLLNIEYSARKEVREFVNTISIKKLLSIIRPSNLSHTNAEIQNKLQAYNINNHLELFNFIPHTLLNIEEGLYAFITHISTNLLYPIIWVKPILELEHHMIKSIVENGGGNIISALSLLSFGDNWDNTLERKQKEQLIESIHTTLDEVKPPKWTIKISDTCLLDNYNLGNKKAKINEFYISELFTFSSLFQQDISLAEEVQKIVTNLETIPISFLDDLTKEQCRTLLDLNFSNVSLFLFYPVPLLSKILGVSEEKISTIKKNINLKDLNTRNKKFGIDIALLDSISEKTRDKLKTTGFESIYQLISVDLDTVDLSKEEKEKVEKSFSILYTPMILVAKSFNIKDKDIEKLHAQAIYTYYDLLNLPILEWKKLLKPLFDSADKDNKQFIRELELASKDGMDIIKLDLPKRSTEQLQNIGLDTIEHFCYAPIEYIADRTYLQEDAVIDLKSKLFKSLAFLQELSPKTIIYAYKQKIYTVIDLVNHYHDLPEKIQKEVEPAIETIRDVDILSFKEDKKDVEQQLIDAGYQSYKDVLCDPQILEKKEVYSSIAPYLLANIRFLDLDKKTESKLRENGFNTIADLIVLSPSFVGKNARIKIADITKLVSAINIADIQKNIQKEENKHFTDLEFISKKDQKTLKSMGIYSYEDLRNIRDYHWLYNPKELEKVTVQIEKILKVSILSYPQIYSLSLVDIKQRFYSNNIYKLKDLLISTTPVDRKELDGFIQNIDVFQEKKEENYIQTKVFLQDISPSDLFTNDVDSSGEYFIDIISTIFENTATLSEKGKLIHKILETPITIITELDQQQISILKETNIQVIADLFVKPAEYIQDSLNKKLSEHIENMLPKLDMTTLQKYYDKRVKTADLTFLSEKTLKEVTNEFNIIDQLYLAIKSNNSPFNKSVTTNIMKKLDESLLLVKIPKLTIDNWLKLHETIPTVKDFLMAHPHRLADICGLDEEEILSLQKSITDAQFIRAPRISKNKIFTGTSVLKLKEEGFIDYPSLFSVASKDSKLTDKLKHQINFTTEYYLNEFDRYNLSLTLKDLIFLSYHIDELKDTEKRLNELKQMIDVFLSAGKGLEEIFPKLDEKQLEEIGYYTIEFLLILHDNNTEIFEEILNLFDDNISTLILNLIDDLSRHPIILKGPRWDNIKLFAELPYSSIKQLFFIPSTELRELDNSLYLNFRKIKPSFLEELKDELITISLLSFDEQKISHLERYNLKFIEEALIYNIQSSSQTSKLWQYSDEIRRIMHMNPLQLPKVVQNEIIANEVNEKQLKNIYDFILFFIQNDDKQIQKHFSSILKDLNPENIEKFEEQERERFNNFIKDVNLIKQLKENNIDCIGLLTPLINSKLPDTLTDEIKNLISTLTAPVGLIVTHATIESKLIKQGVAQVFDFIQPPNNDKFLDIYLTDNQKQRVLSKLENLTYPKLWEELENRSSRLEKCLFLKKEHLDALRRVGYTHIYHLNLPAGLISTYTDLNKSEVQEITDILSSPIYLLNDLIIGHPQAIMNLYKSRLSTLKDLYLNKNQTISDISGIEKKKVDYYLASFSEDNLVPGKNDEVLLTTSIPGFSRDYLQELKDREFRTVQDLILPTETQSNSKYYKDDRMNNLLKTYKSNISLLDVNTKDLKSIKSLGIQTIQEFILYPTSELEKIISLDAKEIRDIKRKVPIKTKKTTTKKTSTKKKTTTKKTSTKKKTTTKKTSTKKKTSKGGSR